MAKKDNKDMILDIKKYAKAYKYVQANREYPNQPEYKLVDKLLEKYHSADSDEKRKKYKEILDELQEFLKEKLKIYEEQVAKLKEEMTRGYGYEQNKHYN